MLYVLSFESLKNFGLKVVQNTFFLEIYITFLLEIVYVLLSNLIYNENNMVESLKYQKMIF